MEVKLPDEASLKSVLAIRKFVVLPGITAVVVILLSIFFLSPQVRSIFESRKEIEKKSDELEDLEEKVDFLESLDEYRLEEQVKILEEVLPSNKAVIQWMNSLNGAAGESNVALGVIALRPGSIATQAATASASQASSKALQRKVASGKSEDKIGTGGLESFDIEFDAIGRVEGIKEFLNRILKASPLLRISDLALEPDVRYRGGEISQDAYRGENVNVKVGMLLFYSPLPSDLGSVNKKMLSISEDQAELYEELLDFTSYKDATSSNYPVGREDIFASF